MDNTPTRQVICRFCKQLASYSPLNEMDRMGVDVYFCHPCLAEYLYFKDADYASSCSLYTHLNGKEYRWTTTATGRAALWYIKKPGTPGAQIGRELTTLFTLSPEDNQPRITPENVARKIKTILIFL